MRAINAWAAYEATANNVRAGAVGSADLQRDRCGAKRQGLSVATDKRGGRAAYETTVKTRGLGWVSSKPGSAAKGDQGMGLCQVQGPASPSLPLAVRALCLCFPTRRPFCKRACRCAWPWRSSPSFFRLP